MTIQRERILVLPSRPLILADLKVVRRRIPGRQGWVSAEVRAACAGCGAAKHMIREVPSRMADRQVFLLVRYLNRLGWRYSGTGRVLCPVHSLR